MRHALKLFVGFVSVEQLHPVKDPTAIHLLLKFETMEHLQAWLKSKIHNKFMAELADVRVKKQQSEIYEVKG